MEADTRCQRSQQIPQDREIQNGDTRDNKDLHPDRGVGYVHRIQGRILSYTHPEPVQKIGKVSRPGSDLFKALPFGLSTAPMDLAIVTKEVKLMALQRGIRIHQYLDNRVVPARSHQSCPQHTANSSS